jgi:hypothetical protein
MSSVLLALQDELTAKLAADSFFASLPVLTEKARNLNFEVQQQVDSLGIVCVVMTPLAGVRHPEAPGPCLDQVAVTVRVKESAELNSGPHALEVAEKVAALLHQYQPSAVAQTLFAASETITRQDDDSLLIYDVRFETRDGFSSEVSA